jgi:hypothetical protein
MLLVSLTHLPLSHPGMGRFSCRFHEDWQQYLIHQHLYLAHVNRGAVQEILQAVVTAAFLGDMICRDMYLEDQAHPAAHRLATASANGCAGGQTDPHRRGEGALRVYC